MVLHTVPIDHELTLYPKNAFEKSFKPKIWIPRMFKCYNVFQMIGALLLLGFLKVKADFRSSRRASVFSIICQLFYIRSALF